MYIFCGLQVGGARNLAKILSFLNLIHQDTKSIEKLFYQNNLRGDRRRKYECFFGKLTNGLGPPPPRPFLEITLRFFPENL